MAFARFSSLADAAPDTEALSGPSFSVTRHQLRQAALVVAQRLLDAARHQGGAHGSGTPSEHHLSQRVVVVALPRGRDYCAAVLGAVAAGCVWCPVDVDWCVPVARLCVCRALPCAHTWPLPRPARTVPFYLFSSCD